MKFFIVTPSYNQGAFIQDTISSVTSSFHYLSHHVIDGLSNDETLSILQHNSHKIEYFSSEADYGQTNALNKGFSRRAGDVCTWLNSDDYYLPTAIDRVASVFEQNPDIHVIHGSSKLVDSTNKYIGVDKGQSHGLPHRYYAGMCFPQPSSFIRSAAFDSVYPLNEELTYGMDYELFLRLKLLGFQFHRIPSILSAYRYHNVSKTISNPLGFADDWLQIFCNFLYDEPSGHHSLSILSELGLHRTQTRSYKRATNYHQPDLNSILYYHLHYQAYFRYTASSFTLLKPIIKKMLSMNPPSRLTPPLLRMYLALTLRHS